MRGHWRQITSGLALLLLIYLIFVAVPTLMSTQQAESIPDEPRLVAISPLATPSSTPNAEPTAAPSPWATDAFPTAQPTSPPIPTALPTPQVTAIPTSIPPFLTALAEKALEPFWIYHWQDNEIWRIDNLGETRELILDTHQAWGQWLTAHPMTGTDCCWSGSRVVISPDKQKLAIITVDKEKLEFKGEPFTFNIFVYDLLLQQHTLISAGVEVAWAPDSRKIAFEMDQDLWVAELESGQLHKIPRPDVQEFALGQYVWSPDSTQLAFTRNAMRAYHLPPTIWIADTLGQGDPVQVFTGDAEVDRLLWSPNSAEIFYSSEQGSKDHYEVHQVQNLWSVDLATGEAQQRTEEMVVYAHHFLPDSDWLLLTGYQLYERGPEDDIQYDLWLLHTQRQELHRITAETELVGLVDWTPDEAHWVLWQLQSHLEIRSIANGTSERIPGLEIGEYGNPYFTIGGAK